MLFDLRSRGRRRLVKFIYLGLALLLGGGLVLFGIGGEVSGGLVDAFNGSSGSADNTFEDRAKEAQERVDANPQDPEAWAQLAVARFALAQTGENMEQVVDQQSGMVSRQFTESGRAELAEADRAWQRHLKLAGDEPDPNVAASMVQLYSEGALDDPAKGAEAAEAVISGGKAGAGQYANLAVFAYRAGQNRKGDLAADKALELAETKDERKELRQAFAEAKTGGLTTTAETPSG
jgi:hypothetical protein